MSNNIAEFEGEHTIFCLLSLVNFTKDDVLQFHPFTDKISFFFIAE
jgi:hypothetical protein